jgi:hypothetical protein
MVGVESESCKRGAPVCFIRVCGRVGRSEQSTSVERLPASSKKIPLTCIEKGRVSRTLGNRRPFCLYAEGVIQQSPGSSFTPWVILTRISLGPASTLSRPRSWSEELPPKGLTIPATWSPATRSATWAELYNAFGVKAKTGNRSPRVRETRPWAVLYNAFGVKAKTGNRPPRVCEAPSGVCSRSARGSSRGRDEYTM